MEFNSQVISSFKLNGKKIDLSRFDNKTYENLNINFDFVSHEKGVSEWLTTIKNEGNENSGIITEFLGLDIKYPIGKNGKFIYRGLEGDYCDQRSFMPQEKEISAGETFVIEPQRGRPSQETAFPFFDFSIDDKTYVLALGWSGQWFCEISRDGDSVNIKAGQRDCEYYLLPNETARSVRVLIYTNEGNVDSVRHKFKKVLRKYYSPATYLGQDFNVPLSVQDFDRYYNTDPKYRTEAGQLQIIDNAKNCNGNINTFWIDAVWFREGFPCGVGNYEFAPGFANGLSGISDYAAKFGMKFMVWFEPERINTGSDIFANIGDSETGSSGWLLNIPNGLAYDNRLYNLGNPQALKWLTDTLIKFISDNKVTIYREDFNIDPLLFWQSNDTENRKGITEMRFIEGLYKMWDDIIAAFPEIMIDNCSSGGRRIDLETVKRAVPCWRSDTGCGPNTIERPVGTWHQNQTVNLSRYLPYHLTSSWFEKAYEFRSGMTMGIACGFDFMRDDYDAAKAILATDELVRIRKYWLGDFYKITEPTCDETIWFAYQLHDNNCGMAVVFRRRYCDTSEYNLLLNEIDLNSNYHVFVYDENYDCETMEYSGKELNCGLKLKSGEPFTSFLIEYKKI